MRKIFGLLSLLITIYTGNAQEIVLPGTSYNGNYGGNLTTGNITPQINLFDLETVNSSLNLQAKLTYDQTFHIYEEELDYESKSFFDKGWDINIIPNITKHIPEQNSDDETTYSKTGECLKYINPTIYSFNAFGLEGKFTFVQENQNMAITQLYTSDFVDITADFEYSATPGQEIFKINSFTLTDKNGIQYVFNEKQKSWYNMQKFGGPGAPGCNEIYEINRSFLLSEVTDKYNRTLITYQYASYTDQIKFGNQNYPFDQKYLSSILIPNKSKVDFIMDTNNKRYSSIRILKNNNGTSFSLYRTIELPNPNGQPKIVIFKNHQSQTDFEYRIRTNYTYPDNSLVIEVTSPLKGITRYEFEKNDYAYVGNSAMNLPDYRIEEELLAITDLSDNTYSKYSFYVPDEYLDNDEIQLYYNSFEKPTPFPSGMFIPLSLCMPDNSLLPLGQPGVQNDITQVLKQHKALFSGNVFCVRGPAWDYEYTDLQIKRVYKVPDATVEKKVPFSGYRIHKIINKNEQGEIVGEKKFIYREKDDPYTSSGSMDYDYHSGYLAYINIYSSIPFFINYRYVTVEETGKGKTTYDFTQTPISWRENNVWGLSNLSVIPTNSFSYDDTGKLTAAEATEFELYSTGNHLLKKLTTTATVYVPGSTTKKLTTITESSFDPVTRHLTHRKITDVRLAQTFEEEHQYQKLGDAYYQTAVKKYKNGTMINQSKAEYAPINSTTLANVYALEKSAVAKGTQPFETEKEITKRDNKGNILEYKTKEGLYVSQIWGYNDTKVVAELKNQRYVQIASGTIATIKNNSASTSYNETGLTTALNGLRTTYPNAFITTYTYIPMVGLKTTTDANGRKETYQYDDFNRLYRVLNHEGNIVKEYNYNIKN